MKRYLLALTISALAACQLPNEQKETVATEAEVPAGSGSLDGIWLRKSGNILDGLQFDSSGRLHYLNMYTITGDAWLQQGDTLMLVSHTDRYPQPDTAKYLLALMPDTLKLTMINTSEAAAPTPEVYYRWKGNPTTGAFAGRWTGPEGTWLEVFPASDSTFTLTFMNMDKDLTQVNGKAVDGQIVFDRNGKTDTLRSATGDETGMKWLAGKLSCVRVGTGEGYCKD